MTEVLSAMIAVPELPEQADTWVPRLASDARSLPVPRCCVVEAFEALQIRQ